ncbi:hypothetical protein BDK92_2741 [Micromonospora pisi]|uniref:Uncharacterized protein n=1 Tax=Micromonospora pisi TaxID=589240 RepID=A0A495JIM4_9ACTN|nr:hypothetical protein [Micromonospora pisi]RKR88418.1 hypothetical protein BDK92_2741 [Micromonospora pisi]
MVVAAAWRAGVTVVAELADVIGVSEATIYLDLQAAGINTSEETSASTVMTRAIEEMRRSGRMMKGREIVEQYGCSAVYAYRVRQRARAALEQHL